MTIFTATSGDYSQIASLLTPTDGEQFLAIVAALVAHASQSRKFVNGVISDEYNTIQDYAMGKIKVSIDGDYLLPSIASLIATGVLISDDNVHIGISLLGLGFYQYYLEN